jgi:hypothetical protein
MGTQQGVRRCEVDPSGLFRYPGTVGGAGVSVLPHDPVSVRVDDDDAMVVVIVEDDVL